MKADAVNQSWYAIKSGLKKFINSDAKKNNASVLKPAQKNYEKYSAWPQLNSDMSKVRTHRQVSEVNIRILEEFMKQVLLEDLTYKKFMSTHLSFANIDWQSPNDIQRMMAIKNLANLIQSTIQEMKSIEINHIAKSRG